MQTVSSLEQLKTLPLEERIRWYIPERLLTSLPIVEYEEPLVNLWVVLKQSGVTVVLKPINQSAGAEMLLRQGAAERLAQAATKIFQESKGERALKITDAFRPLAIQRKYFEEIKEKIRQEEGLDGRPLWERVTQFIADPDLCPPHSTGGAVDCTLINIRSGEEISMGTAVDTVDDRSNTWHDSLSATERDNRQMLIQAMTAAGFVNLPSEWWHYSFGDQYWAAFLGKPYAIYGSIEKFN